MRLQIDALDTLFFRDGKPFTMGSDTWGSGIFPPHPSMVYGALRSLYFSYNIKELKTASSIDEINPEDPTKALTITGFYLQHGNDLIFPVPMDCVKEKDGKEKNKLLPLKPEKTQCRSNCKTSLILRPEGRQQIENVEDGWINSITLKDYLNGDYDNMYYLELSNVVLSEPKIGIGRNNKSRTAEDSKLYRVGMKRLKGISIVVDIEGLDIPLSGIMKIGGEGRPALFKSEDIKLIPPPPLKVNKLKLYIATPAIFQKGWLPGGIDPNSLEGVINGIRLKLLAAAIGRPLYIGGFDIKKHRPKSMKRAVPAGSVYYFEIQGNYTNEEIINALHNKAISDSPLDRQQGFGIACVGKWE